MILVTLCLLSFGQKEWKVVAVTHLPGSNERYFSAVIDRFNSDHLKQDRCKMELWGAELRGDGTLIKGTKQ